MILGTRFIFWGCFMVNYRVISDKFNLERRESISENFLKLGID